MLQLAIQTLCNDLQERSQSTDPLTLSKTTDFYDKIGVFSVSFRKHERFSVETKKETIHENRFSVLLQLDPHENASSHFGHQKRSGRASFKHDHRFVSSRQFVWHQNENEIQIEIEMNSLSSTLMNCKIESDKLNQCFIFIWLILFCSGASLTEGFHPGISLIMTRQLIVASYSLDVLGSQETILKSKLQATMIPTSNDKLQEARIFAQERYTTTQQEQLPETFSKPILSAQSSSHDRLNRGTLHFTGSVVRESLEVPPTHEHSTSHSSEVISCIPFPTDTAVYSGTLSFIEVADPQEEIRPNKIEHSTSQKVSDGEIYSNKNEHTTSQDVSDGHGESPSQEAPRSLRHSEWICNTSIIIKSSAETNGEKTHVRTYDTASRNDNSKLMTVESHLPTQKAT